MIQAYTEATKQALLHASFLGKELMKNLKISYSYDQLSIVQYLFSKYETKIITEHYGSTIEQTISINLAFFEIFKKELQEKQISILE